jgi:hypothetical protein
MEMSLHGSLSHPEFLSNFKIVGPSQENLQDIAFAGTEIHGLAFRWITAFLFGIYQWKRTLHPRELPVKSVMVEQRVHEMGMRSRWELRV